MTYRYRSKDFLIHTIGPNVGEEDIFNIKRILFPLVEKGINWEWIWKSKDPDYIYLVTEH